MIPKPYWQAGWLKQHDRLMAAIGAMKGRAPLVMSGDLHAIGAGRMLRSGDLDFKANPITVVLNGPVGTRTGPNGWPSGRRGTGALPPAHLDMDEEVKPIEQHGFTIVDFAPDKMTAAVVQVGLEDAKRGGDRCAGAVSQNGTAASSMTYPA